MDFIRALFRVLRIASTLVIHALVLFIAWCAFLELAASSFGWERFLGGVRPLTSLLQGLFPHNLHPDVKFGSLLTHLILAVLMLLPVLHWMGHLIGSLGLKRDVLKVRTPDGRTMMLNPSSMKMFVKVQLDSHPDVVSHSIRVYQVGSQGLRIEGDVDVGSVRSLPEIEAELMALLKSSFKRIMGVDEVRDIKLIMGLPKKSLRKFSAVEGAPAPVPEPPVRDMLDSATTGPGKDPADNADRKPDSSGQAGFHTMNPAAEEGRRDP